MTTFDQNFISFSFTDMFDTFSVYPYNYNTQDEEFESKLKKDLYKIKIIFICLFFLIILVTILCILKNYKLLLQDFQNKKILYVPKSTVFFSQIIIASIYFYKNIMKITDNMSKYIVETIKNQVIKSDNNSSNNIWQDISDRCYSNFDKVFKDIISDFEDDEININYNFPISKYLHIKDEDLKKTMAEFNEKYGLDIVKWEKTNDLLSNIFSEKYREFKSIESKLMEIKSKMSELNNWSKSTESLLKNLEEKDNSNNNIKEVVNNYVKSKLDNLNFPSLITKYQELYLELRSLVKFFRKNPDIELLSRCQICLTNLKNSIIVPCGHTACKDCLDYQQKLDKKIICPICRQEGTSIAKIFN